MWLDQLRDTLAAQLAGATTGILYADQAGSGAALPVWYQSADLCVSCLVPRWSDLADALARQQPQPAVLIVPALADPRRWLRYRGEAGLTAHSAWSGIWPERLTARQADERWLVVALTPQRIDLFDEQRGWGARETLDLASA